MSSNPDKPKVISFISRRAPYSSAHARSCLDMVPAAAIFDQQVYYIFLDDGVYQLLSGQSPAGIMHKSLSAALEALPLYGVENLIVETESLAARNVSAAQLQLPGVQTLNSEKISQIIRDSDHVFTL